MHETRFKELTNDPKHVDKIRHQNLYGSLDSIKELGFTEDHYHMCGHVIDDPEFDDPTYTAPKPASRTINDQDIVQTFYEALNTI